jgi:Domain of unknown function (DUF4160)
VVYPNDHPPAHVHVVGPGWVVVVNLLESEVREAIRCSEGEARRVLQLVAPHRKALIEKWRQFHG